MPKVIKAPPLSSDRTKARPYRRSTKNTNQNRSEKSVESIGDENEWKEAICPICMEPPHNSVLLLCSSHEKGCRPYMCDTSSHQTNCLTQFRKPSTTRKLLCPFCRGQVNGVIGVKPARMFLNAKPRSCSHETCEFRGTYSALEKHAMVVHPLVQPSKAGAVRQQNWTELERETRAQDLLSMFQTEWEEEEEEEEEEEVEESEIGSSVANIERSFPDNSSFGSSGVRGQSHTFRSARARITVGIAPRQQLASRSAGYRSN